MTLNSPLPFPQQLYFNHISMAVFWVVKSAHSAEPYLYPLYVATVIQIECTSLQLYE